MDTIDKIVTIQYWAFENAFSLGNIDRSITLSTNRTLSRLLERYVCEVWTTGRPGRQGRPRLGDIQDKWNVRINSRPVQMEGQDIWKTRTYGMSGSVVGWDQWMTRTNRRQGPMEGQKPRLRLKQPTGSANGRQGRSSPRSRMSCFAGTRRGTRLISARQREHNPSYVVLRVQPVVANTRRARNKTPRSHPPINCRR